MALRGAVGDDAECAGAGGAVRGANNDGNGAEGAGTVDDGAGGAVCGVVEAMRNAAWWEALCAAQTTTAMAPRGALGEERDAEARRHLPLEPVNDRVEQHVERRVERLQRVGLRLELPDEPRLVVDRFVNCKT